MESETKGRVNHLFLCKHMSDVRFTFPSLRSRAEGNRLYENYGGLYRSTAVEFPAHKSVLCRQSVVFQAMLYGPLAAREDTVKLEDIESEVMKELLRFVYCGKVRLNGDNVFRCVYAAKKYDITGLIQECVTFLKDNIRIDNVCSIYVHVLFFDLSTVQNHCQEFILENAAKVLTTDGFLELPHDTLLELLKSDEMNAEEVDIFKACVCWSERKCKLNALEITPSNLRSHLDNAIYQIRFPIMCKGDFVDSVIPTQILSNEEENEICEYLATPVLTPLNRFICRERTGRYITTVDMNYYIKRHRTSNIRGCHLRIGCQQESCHRGQPENIDNRKTCHRGQPEDWPRLKVITGSFVPTVRQISRIESDDQKTKLDNYKIDYSSNSIIFLKAVEITEDTHLTFQTCEEYSYRNPQGVLIVIPKGRMIMTDKFHSTVLEVFVRGVPCVISQIPKGLFSLTFLK